MDKLSRKRLSDKLLAEVYNRKKEELRVKVLAKVREFEKSPKMQLAAKRVLDAQRRVNQTSEALRKETKKMDDFIAKSLGVSTEQLYRTLDRNGKVKIGLSASAFGTKRIDDAFFNLRIDLETSDDQAAVINRFLNLEV